MKKIMTLIMLLLSVMLVFTGCTKNVTVNEAPKDSATSSVSQGISDAENLTSLDDASLEQNLGSADKTLENW